MKSRRVSLTTTRRTPTDTYREDRIDECGMFPLNVIMFRAPAEVFCGALNGHEPARVKRVQEFFAANSKNETFCFRDEA